MADHKLFEIHNTVHQTPKDVLLYKIINQRRSDNSTNLLYLDDRITSGRNKITTTSKNFICRIICSKLHNWKC